MVTQSVCAVIVTYNPAATLVDNVVAVATQVGKVVVIDNGSSASTATYLQHLETKLRCHVIRNHQNLGISAALNLGAKYAIEGGFDWISTFDQDSQVCEGFISKMLEVYRRASHPEGVALIAPKYVDRETGVEVRLRRASNGEILATMTSGSMIPSKVIARLGFFDETLYMDGVDKEFCLRARREGMFIIQSPAVLLHSLGRTTYHRLFGLRFGATNHSARRRYYITRNGLRLLIRYAKDWPWAWREIRWMLCDAAKIILVEDDKWKKFRAMMAGSADALSGKMGKQVEL
jgi:rhamnosyltransferase